MNKGTAARSLRELYRQKSDEEMLAMWNSRSNFTDIARQALENVLAERGLSTAPAVVAPEAAPAKGLAEGIELAEDEVEVYRFGNTMDLNRAIERLEQEGIEFRVQDLTEQLLGSRSRTPQLELGLIVRLKDEARARTLSLEVMGLQEVAGAEDPFKTMPGFESLGFFQRADALTVAQTLAAEGISYLWNDPQDDPKAESSEADEIVIEVRGISLERALAIVESRLSTHG